MLDLRRDLYAHLVLSTQRNKSLNTSFRVIHADIWDKYPVNQTTEIDDTTIFEKKISEINTLKPIPKKTIPDRIIRPSKIEKIDDKVDKMVNDPKIAEIKMELEVAEKLLEKIKSIDVHNSKIPMLEQTVFRLKTLLEQKSYI